MENEFRRRKLRRNCSRIRPEFLAFIPARSAVSEGHWRGQSPGIGESEEPPGDLRPAAVAFQNDNFKPNWNWRGSNAAVGCPALVQSTLTSAMLNLLIKLNMSTVPSSLKRSVRLNSRPMRRSVKTVVGFMPALRLRLPTNVPFR